MSSGWATRYVRITDIDERDGLRVDTFKSLPTAVAEEYLLQECDLLFARSGATAGKTFLYRRSWGPCAYAGYLIRARLDTTKVWPEFVRYFTAGSSYWQWLSAAFIQATIQNVSAERFANLGEIPAPWELKRIKSLSNFVTSGSRGWAEHYTDEGALFLRIGNLRTGSIDLDLSDVQHVTPPRGAEGQRTCVLAGDVLVSITALIGAVAVVPKGTPAAFVNQHLALVRLSSREVLPRWLGYCVLSRVGQEQLRGDLYGGTKDGLSLDDIRSLTVLIPPTDEQQRVIDILDRTDRHIEVLVTRVREAIHRLKELRTALISAAVTGKIDVRGEAA